MKKVEAIIRPQKLEEIKEELTKAGVQGLTVSEVAGCGLQKGKVGIYRGNEFTLNLLPKVKLEIVVKDDLLETLIEVLMKAARTGQIGDGKIFVYSAEDVIRIRTGERGNDAL